MTDGQNSPLAAVLETRDGKVFVKGLPSDHRLVITQAREAAAASLVKGISPELLWQFDESGWNVLGFEHIDGRLAEYRPGSPDIGLVAELMQTLADRLGVGDSRAILDRPRVLAAAAYRSRPSHRGSRSHRRPAACVSRR